MSVFKTAGAFADCKQIMDLALDQPGMSIDFDTHAQAARFRQRCHSFRKRLFDAAHPAPGALPATPYDALVFSIPNKGTPGDCTLTINNREEAALNLLSRIRSAEGEPLAPPEQESADAAVEALRGKLGLE